MLKEQILANHISKLGDQLDAEIRVLSLDCFDTLLFRQVTTPVDVFYASQSRSTFSEVGLSAKLRIEAENRARKKNVLDTGKSEVTLRDIYLAHDESLQEAQLLSLAEEEIAVEKDVCYAFPPVVALIRRAKELRIKVIVVSDTYFTERQLRALLAHRLPADVYEAISVVLCSCDFGYSKAAGLFKVALAKVKTSPKRIVHIGDNLAADFLAPRALGLKAVHIIHNDENAARLARLRNSAGMLLDPNLRQARAFGNPFGGVIAASHIDETRPETTLGYLSLGPIMYAFSEFVAKSVKSLSAEGKRPKVVFLMRDGFLPWRACQALTGEDFGRPVRISRFAANAASFRTKADVDRYLGEAVSSQNFEAISRQLLLPLDVARGFDQHATSARHPTAAFVRLIHQESVLSDIFDASLRYRKRLMKHLANEVDLCSGDTLVLVDLGYTGTVQLRLQEVLKEELNVDVCGRYLIALRTPHWERTRQGLLDPSWCDDRAMLAIVQHIALVEQLCTSSERSVVDYEDNGTPIYSNVSMGQEQHAIVATIQNEVLRFITDAKSFAFNNDISFNDAAMRDHAMAELARVVYLPTADELRVMQAFEFDINIGTDDVQKLVDEAKGLEGLRRRGLFFMEHQRASMRMNYPAELRSAGVELSLLLAQQIRSGIDLRQTDLSLRREPLDVIVLAGKSASSEKIEAIPTYDGFWSLVLPIGSGQLKLGIQFGRRYQWLQIESADIVVAAALNTSRESECTADVRSLMVFDQMQERAGGLYECTAETGLLVFMVPSALDRVNHVFRVVFRPLVFKNSTVTSSN
jgi:FMN phosphatase YigB (HAD superfamily)